LILGFETNGSVSPYDERRGAGPRGEEKKITRRSERGGGMPSRPLAKVRKYKRIKTEKGRQETELANN